MSADAPVDPSARTARPARPAWRAWRAWRAWLPDLVVGLVVLSFGVDVALNTAVSTSPRSALLAVAVLTALAVGLCRASPAAALGVAWLLGVWQVVSGTDLMFVELALAAVAFGCARWGSVPTVVLGAVSIPLAVAAALAYVGLHGFATVTNGALDSLLRYAYDSADGAGARAFAVVIGLVLLAAPWLAGLALRFLSRARASRSSLVEAEADAARALHERDQAEEIARLRDQQARLARDVHDVVGHSLATILTQADAGQYADDPGALRTSLANIATSARSSLDDVRHVLAADAEPPSRRENDLDVLVEGVRASGHEVASTEHGRRRPLPPELETVSYRVLQEMLTNAIKHGARTTPITVERHWEGELRVEVRNAIPGTPSAVDVEHTQPIGAVRAGGGTGVEGMRRRLGSVGGRLDVRRRDQADGSTYTATAWIPLRRHE